MRILACSLTYPLPNGVTSSINESIDGFKEAGHEVYILSPNYDGGKNRPEHVYVPSSAIGREMFKYYTHTEKDEWRMFGIGARSAIKKIIHDLRPDAFWLHTVTWAPNAFERVIVKNKLPKILTYHTNVDVYGKLYLGVIGETRMIARSAEIANEMNHVITPSHFIASKLIGWGVTTPISVISSGIEPVRGGYSKAELAKMFSFKPTATVLIFVGRVVKEKNIAALFKMTATLVKTRSDIVLLLVGPGEIEEMKDEAEKLGIAKNIVFTGQLPLEEARRCYKGADLFVFASQSETQGLVVGEAMSAGLPVVALASPVQPEVYPESTAVVVKSEDQLAGGVLDLLTNKKKAADLAEVGKKFVTENFSKETMIKKQIKVFESLLH